MLDDLGELHGSSIMMSMRMLGSAKWSYASDIHFFFYTDDMGFEFRGRNFLRW